MSVTFAREPLTDALLDELLPLLTEHYGEVAHFQDIPLDVDRERYLAAEAAGFFRLYTARDTLGVGWRLNENGKHTVLPHPLVGYAAYMVNTNPHYRTSLQAVQDVLYLEPSARGGTGYRFIAWCDQQLAAEGVQAVYHHSKAAHDFGRLLERQGYELVDLIYAKRLDTPRVDRPSAVEALGEALGEAFI